MGTFDLVFLPVSKTILYAFQEVQQTLKQVSVCKRKYFLTSNSTAFHIDFWGSANHLEHEIPNLAVIFIFEEIAHQPPTYSMDFSFFIFCGQINYGNILQALQDCVQVMGEQTETFGYFSSSNVLEVFLGISGRLLFGEVLRSSCKPPPLGWTQLLWVKALGILL